MLGSRAQHIAEGFREGVTAATTLTDRVIAELTAVITTLRFELSVARDREVDLARQLAEARERADVAADELLLLQGGRRAISQASRRLDERPVTPRPVVEPGDDPFEPLPIGDPRGTFASEEEARGEYA